MLSTIRPLVFMICLLYTIRYNVAQIARYWIYIEQISIVA